MSRRESDKERERKNEEEWEGMRGTGRSYGEKGEIRLFVCVCVLARMRACVCVFARRRNCNKKDNGM